MGFPPKILKDVAGGLLKVAGSLGKGKLTTVGVVTTIIGAVATSIFAGHSTTVTTVLPTVVDSIGIVKDTVSVIVTGNNDPLASLKIIVDLCKQAWPHVIVILGFLSTLAGFFRKAGAVAVVEDVKKGIDVTSVKK